MDTPKSGLRQRVFAWALARLNARYERFVSKYKRELFADVSGNVLEIGPGTGANLRYLPNGVRWMGVEPNPFMQSYLREEAHKLDLSIDVRIGTADALPVPDNSIDVVISTLVLCCVPSPQRCLQEILRVLKPGGRFLFIEHVAAPRGTRLWRIQNLVTPLWKRLGDGCHPNRETWIDLERAGFGKVTCETITAPTPIVSPQIVGVAAKAV
ncbi:MAG TPA: methyltransferase domain-containing protein [Candidatus Sulfotelmatobacter sp.]|nr:methyltransferase domain-containing protein [Candidatus Sulfotelmatobacter sp.]